MTIESKTMTETSPVAPTAAPGRHAATATRTVGSLLFVMAAALAGCGGSSSDDTPAAAQPPAAQPPAAQPPAGQPPAAQPPATPAPSTVPAGMATVGTPLANTGIVYYKDANTNGALDAGERAVVYNPTTQHYYELVTNFSAPNVPAGLTWDAALTGAQARGGYLLIGEATGEIEFVRSTYAYAAGAAVPTHGGLQISEDNGSLGAWVGLVAATGATHGVWSWIKTDGGTVGGTALAAGAPWLVHATFTNPDGDPTTGGLRGAMTGGNSLAGTDGAPAGAQLQQCLFDAQASAAKDPVNATDPYLISRYVVEYDSAAAIK